MGKKSLSRTDDRLEAQIRERILATMAEKNLREIDLARESQIEVPTLHKILSGDRGLDLKYIRPIASGLGVSYEWLVTGHGEIRRSENHRRPTSDIAAFKGWLRHEGTNAIIRRVEDVLRAYGIDPAEKPPELIEEAASTPPGPSSPTQSAAKPEARPRSDEELMERARRRIQRSTPDHEQDRKLERREQPAEEPEAPHEPKGRRRGSHGR